MFWQVAGTEKAFQADNMGRCEEWPITESRDGSVTIDTKLMRIDFPYDAMLADEAVQFQLDEDGTLGAYREMSNIEAAVYVVAGIMLVGLWERFCALWVERNSPAPRGRD
jgi:hypothetical protein